MKIALRNIITRNNKNESEPPRCCNDDVRPGREVLALVDHVLAADDDANVEIHRLADDFELDKKCEGFDLDKVVGCTHNETICLIRF